MEWIETTGRSVEEAKELALDRLGVDPTDAEFEVVAEPRPGLFGRIRGEARVRARVRPTEARPKQERRRRAAGKAGDDSGGRSRAGTANGGGRGRGERSVAMGDQAPSGETAPRPARSENGPRGRAAAPSTNREARPVNEYDDEGDATVDPEVVGQAAVDFMQGLADSFGLAASTSLRVEGTELEVSVDGQELGLLVGPGGRTLAAIQDLARVAAQRRLGDHATRLRVDVAGYRERRRAALERFATTVADEVRASGTARALEPMPSADRKVIHDVLSTLVGVTSRSEGDEPRRRIVVVPA